MTTKEDIPKRVTDPMLEQLALLMETNRKQSEIIESQAKTIEELRVTIVELNASLAWLKRKVFGKMSEKCNPINNGDPMLPFDYGDLGQIEAEIEAARNKAAQIITPKPQVAGKTPRRNRIIMDDLPVVTVIIEPENLDLDKYVKIGEEHTRTLEMKPGYLYVKDTVRPTYAIKDETEAIENGKRMVVTAPLPLMPIYKGMPGASMLAEILLQKYEYHVPFYRQVKQLEHLGVKLSRNTLDGWFKPVCALLRPLYLELKKKVLSSDYIQVDETTLPVIDHDRHKAAKEYIWIVRAAVPRLLFFHYANGSRSQKVAVDLLKTFKGYLQCDGYSAYDAFENRKDVCLCGCLAHIRRHIESCREENREYAMQGLKFIQDLYNVEYMADEQQLSYEERAALRQRLAGPLLDAFELWLQNTYPKVLKRSLMGKAIAYAYPLIPRMRHYLYDGRIFIDNNRAENALRPMVLTRKNMLFCGNRQAAENTAVICSLLGSCKECGVNPREWLNDVISKLPYYLTPKSEKNLTELLPDRWGGYRQSHDTRQTFPGLSIDKLYTQPETLTNQ